MQTKFKLNYELFNYSLLSTDCIFAIMNVKGGCK